MTISKREGIMRSKKSTRATSPEDQFLSAFATGEDLDPDCYPCLRNLSAAFFYQLLPRPAETKPPEYVYISPARRLGSYKEEEAKDIITSSTWNLAWEVGHLRSEFFDDKLSGGLAWLKQYEGKNVYLVPRGRKDQHVAYAPLHHLLPRRTMERYGLPLLKGCVWPWSNVMVEDNLADHGFHDFDYRLAHAFAAHVWGLLCPGSPISAFSKDDPVVLLSHNLDYWLPHAIRVAENRLRCFPRVEIEDEEQARRLERLQREMPKEIIPGTPLKGGVVWMGEEEALEATREMVEVADGHGKLRGILDAVRANRVEEDFSSRWSFAREDFERRLYSKRSKIKVKFVELDDTIPVHGPESEVHENLLWADFLGLLNRKEREIVVLLRNGETKLGDIGKLMGYANHSPVSKALTRIRRKAKTYLDC